MQKRYRHFLREFGNFKLARGVVGVESYAHRDNLAVFALAPQLIVQIDYPQIALLLDAADSFLIIVYFRFSGISKPL